VQVLIADFFFVLLALVWLAAGVGEKSTLNSTVRNTAACPLSTGVYLEKACTAFLTQMCWPILAILSPAHAHEAVHMLLNTSMPLHQ